MEAEEVEVEAIGVEAEAVDETAGSTSLVQTPATIDANGNLSMFLLKK